MIIRIIVSGLESLKEYILLHTLTCLIPAFFLAGAMVNFISREAVIKYLGTAVRKIKSYAYAAGGSFLMAACSCTVIPVASGLYYRGAGIGAAFVFLWVAPAANILALIYTGSILGADMAALRIIVALLMAIVVGSIMTFFFSSQEKKEFVNETESSSRKIIERKDLILIILILITLLAPNYLIQKGPYRYKIYVWAIGTLITAIYALKVESKQALREWLKETFWFMRIIFPFLLLGVFIVGIIGGLLPENVIRNWLGGSSISASFFATIIGTISYFATLTEAPFVHMLIKLGMGKGPAIALLLTGPGVSLPNMLVVTKLFGVNKAVVYYISIVILGTLSGFLVGQFVF